jgi:hypothetical protein
MLCQCYNDVWKRLGNLTRFFSVPFSTITDKLAADTDSSLEQMRRSRSWKKMNPKWKYWFWTDADNRDFVEKNYPEFLDTYNKLPYEIERADMVRCGSSWHCIFKTPIVCVIFCLFLCLAGHSTCTCMAECTLIWTRGASDPWIPWWTNPNCTWQKCPKTLNLDKIYLWVTCWVLICFFNAMAIATEYL